MTNSNLINQLHIKHDHPSKAQLKSIFDKYFYGITTANYIEEVCNQCQLCQATKKLPQQQTFTTTTNAQQPGTHFVCDIMRRAKQNIIVVRDQFSSYTTAKTIVSEKHQDIEDAIIDLITAIRAPSKVIVKTDQATAFQYLAKHKTELQDLNIHIELANDFSKNAVATVDKGMQELQQEIKKIQHSEKPITKAQLSMAIMNLNNRLRRDGQISAIEILFSRDYNKKSNLNLDDKQIAADQQRNREEANTRHNMKNKQPPTGNIAEGDMVMLRQNPHKHKIRDTFIVKSSEENNITMQKVVNPLNSEKKLYRNKQYSVPKNKVFQTKSSMTNDLQSARIKPRYHIFDPVHRSQDSTDESSDESDHEHNHLNELLEDNHSDDDINNDNADNNQFEDNQPNQNETDKESSESDSESEYLSPNENQYQNDPLSPEKLKTPIKEIWITPRQTRNHTKLINLKNNLAAIKIQTWYRKNRTKQRTCKQAAKALIHKQLRGRQTPEIPRASQVNNTEYQISSAEKENKNRYASCTDDNILDKSDISLEWDNNEQCLEVSFTDELNEAFHVQPLNLTFQQGMNLNRVYKFDQVLAEQHSPPTKHTPKASTPMKKTIGVKVQPKSKWKKLLQFKK